MVTNYITSLLHSPNRFLPRNDPMVLPSESALLPETSTPPSCTPGGTRYQSRVDNPRNVDEEDEGDQTLGIPENVLEFSQIRSPPRADPQSVAKLEAFQVVLIPLAATYLTCWTQKQVMAFLSDDDPVRLEEEACRMHLLSTQVEVRVEVEVCVGVAASGMSPSSCQEFVTTNTITTSSPPAPQRPDPQTVRNVHPPHISARTVLNHVLYSIFVLSLPYICRNASSVCALVCHLVRQTGQFLGLLTQPLHTFFSLGSENFDNWGLRMVYSLFV